MPRPELYPGSLYPSFNEFGTGSASYNYNITITTNSTLQQYDSGLYAYSLQRMANATEAVTINVENVQTQIDALTSQVLAQYRVPPVLMYQPLTTGTTGSINLYNTQSIGPETQAQRKERKRQARLDDLAAARAKALLLEHLSDEQRAEYEEHQYFHVLSEGGRLYRIKHGSAGNVYRIGTDGSVEHKFCIHARDSVPHEDNMLAQMLLLRLDEEQFLTVANRHW